MEKYLEQVKTLVRKYDVKALINSKRFKTVAIPIFVLFAVFFFYIEQSNADIGQTSNEAYAIIETGQNEKETSSDVKEEIYVDISGAVKNPGVYMVSEGTRLFQVINLANGLENGADIDSLNQAEKVYDGEKIIIRTKEEAGELSTISDAKLDGKVNINTADAIELQEIPGIGPSKAQSIIKYRETNGRFKSIEDIKNISGIGDKTFESMRDKITV